MVTYIWVNIVPVNVLAASSPHLNQYFHSTLAKLCIIHPRTILQGVPKLYNQFQIYF